MEISIPTFDWTTLGSIGIVGITGLIVLLASLFTRSTKVCLYLSQLGVLAAMGYSIYLWGADKTGFAGMLILDNFTLFIYITVLTGTFLTLFLSNQIINQFKPIKGEYLALILFSALGMMVMGAAGDIVMIFLGLETLSISLYVLAGCRRNDEYSLEAALKYFLLGAFASGFLLFGMSFLYGATKTTNLAQMVAVFQSGAVTSSIYVTLALAFLLIGLGFKVALVPFHMWTPDVYEGAPTPVAAFMSTGVKAAAFAVMIRIFMVTANNFFSDWQGVLWVLAVLTMSIGNIIALSQNNIKRMLAYSSIAHAGYMLVAFTAGTNAAASGILYYLITYTFMNIGAFGVVCYLENKEKDLYSITDYAGMGFKKPVIAAALSIFMFSLAGIPPFAGFFAKFYAFRAAIDSGLVWLVIIGVLNSVVSVYYYLRVVLNMYMKDAEIDFSIYTFKASDAAALVIAILGVFILGLFPSIFVGLASITLF
ncbi:MAG: NADH-quinone oxidoreductase subunit N [bacterium]|nr:NADH-quinone oxidoreductase subunit N [bacterium]